MFSVRTGKLKGKEEVVSVKIYNPNAGVENVSQEIAKLRYAFCLYYTELSLQRQNLFPEMLPLNDCVVINSLLL